MDETYASQHGYKYFHGEWLTMPFPSPAWLVFDAEAYKTKVISAWSSNDDALAKGYLVRGNTLDALAAAINVPAANLRATVAEYNASCSSGGSAAPTPAPWWTNATGRTASGYNTAAKDPLTGRPANTLKAIGEGPYYAVKIVPSHLNTQGGPRRDTECRILDTKGNVIPHLYGVGECGSMFNSTYQAGSNLAEVVISGRIAGKNAANERPVEGTVVLAAVKSNMVYMPGSAANESIAQGSSVSLGANQYLGGALGMDGLITVRVTMSSGKIANVEIVTHNETPGIGTRAVDAIPGAIVKANNPGVDVVSGATITSKAIIEAVKDALSKAN
jgi:uncharacterized protein with FMN-binding domain